jgi:bifunctional DNase/RNase
MEVETMQEGDGCMPMIPMSIVGLQMNPSGTSVVVLAESINADRMLPILIGPAEAQAIAVAVAGIEMPRPGTHDLMLSVMEKLDSRLLKVAVVELVEGTFHAELSIESHSGLCNVSARPSDALALAVRTHVPIYVQSTVMAEAAVDVHRDSDQPLSDEEIDKVVDEFHELLSTAMPEDFVDPEEDVS